jgi:hypothetical protein
VTLIHSYSVHCSKPKNKQFLCDRWVKIKNCSRRSGNSSTNHFRECVPLPPHSRFLPISLIRLYLTDLNWDSVETILRYGIENVQLGTASSTDFPLLLAENYFNTSERKEKVLSLLPCIPPHIFFLLLMFVSCLNSSLRASVFPPPISATMAP